MGTKGRRIAYRSLLILATLIGVVVLVWCFWLYVGSGRYGESREIIPRLTRISHSEGGDLVNNYDKVILSRLPFNLRDSVPVKVNTLKVESLLLRGSNYIKGVNAYISPASKTLHIKFTDRRPIMVGFAGGQGYFIDEDGVRMQSRGGLAANVPVVTGNVPEGETQEMVMKIVQYLNEHEEWSDFFGSIHVVSESVVHLYPRVGDFIFETDGADHLDSDMEKIKLFYRKILPKVGSNKYKLIKLSYEGQIVCKFR